MDNGQPENSAISLKYIRERWNALDPFQKGACVVAISILFAAVVFSGDYSFDVGGMLGGILAVYVGVMVAERQIEENRKQVKEERQESARYAALMFFDPLVKIHSTVRAALEAGTNSLSIEVLTNHGWSRQDVQKFLDKILMGLGPAVREGFDDLEAQYPDLFREDLISRLPVSRFLTYRNNIISLKRNCAAFNKFFNSDGLPFSGEVTRTNLMIFALQAYNSSLAQLFLLGGLVAPTRAVPQFTSESFDRTLKFAREIQAGLAVSPVEAERYLLEITGLAPPRS